MYYKVALSALFLGVLIYVISRAINTADLLQLILNFPKQQLLILCTISSVIAILKTWRFFILSSSLKIDISFLEALRIYISGQVATPVFGGETIRGVLIKKETGERIRNTIGALFSHAFIEIFSAAILSVLGSLVFKVLRISSLLILAFLFLIIAILTSKKILNVIFLKIKKFKKLNSIYKRLKLAQKDIKLLILYKRESFFKILSISLLTHITGGILIYLIARIYNVDINIFQSIFIYSAGILIQGLSISPGGIGFTEGGMVGLFLLFGINLNQALAIVLVFRAVTLIFFVLTGLIFFITFYGKSLLLNKRFMERS